VVCPLARAGADNTKLLYLTALDLLMVFSIGELEDIVELPENHNLIKEEQDPDLILRTLLAEQKKDMARPRQRVLFEKDTPRRIRKIITEHEERTKVECKATGKPLRPRSSVMNQKQREAVVERRSLAKTKGDAFEVVTRGMYHVHIDQLRE
jgi:hypothetical protein